MEKIIFYVYPSVQRLKGTSYVSFIQQDANNHHFKMVHQTFANHRLARSFHDQLKQKAKHKTL